MSDYSLVNISVGIRDKEGAAPTGAAPSVTNLVTHESRLV